MEKSQKVKIILQLVLFLGLIVRFITTFIYPVFNTDEISLGSNIKSRSFIQLLYPLDNYQSAPPAFLLSQKLITIVSPLSFWINIKILTYISSSIALYGFYYFIKEKRNLITLLLLIIFAFNPFIIGNSLTVKQYSFDLLGIIILINIYGNEKLKNKLFLFLFVWTFFSNIALFACAGILLLNTLKFYKKGQHLEWRKFLKSNIPILLIPIPYVIYFIWFMQQPNAEELKAYMVEYWKTAFIPLNGEIFRYLIYLIHQFWIYFYSAYEIWGIFLIFLAGLYFVGVWNNKQLKYLNVLILGLFIFIIHLTLNILKLYPLADRLTLYLAPFFILLLGGSLYIIKDRVKSLRVFHTFLATIGAITFFLYLNYIPIGKNGVPGLYDSLEDLDKNKKIIATKKAFSSISSFDEFTDYYFKTDKNISEMDSVPITGSYLISKVHLKIKPGDYSEEAIVTKFLLNDEIRIYKKLKGFNIYKVN